MKEFSFAERRAIIEKAISTYGEEAQLWMVIEEFSELEKEICKHIRGKKDRDAIIDELADVHIMLDQVEVIFDIDQFDIYRRKQIKLARLRDRLDEKGE